MNLSPEQLPFALLLAVCVIVFAVSRLWLRRHKDRTECRVRVLRIGLALLAVALVGLAFTLRSEPRTWVALGLILLSFTLAERTHSRLRKQVGGANRDEA